MTTCWWTATAQFAHLLAQSGCSVSALCPYGHAVQVVEGVTFYRQRAYLPIQRLSEVIRCSQPSIIVPADDRAVAYLHRLHEIGTEAERALIERSIGSSDRYDVVLSRVRLHATAKRLGIAVPSSWAIKATDEIGSVIGDAPGPWVIKTDGAWSGHGVRIAATREQAAEAALALRRRQHIASALIRLLVYRDPYWLAASIRHERPELSVQSYVKGWPATLAMFCAHGEVLALTMADVVAGLDETGPAVIIRLVDRPDMMLAAQKLAAELGLNGFHGLDFMIDEATGKALLIEMNPRLTPLVNVRLGKAADTIAAAVKHLSGRWMPRRNEGSSGDLVVHYPLPRAFSPDDPRVTGSFDNRPKDAPALLAEMERRPWPDRRLLARAVVTLRKAGLV